MFFPISVGLPHFRSCNAYATLTIASMVACIGTPWTNISTVGSPKKQLIYHPNQCSPVPKCWVIQMLCHTGYSVTPLNWTLCDCLVQGVILSVTYWFIFSVSSFYSWHHCFLWVELVAEAVSKHVRHEGASHQVNVRFWAWILIFLVSAHASLTSSVCGIPTVKKLLQMAGLL